LPGGGKRAGEKKKSNRSEGTLRAGGIHGSSMRKSSKYVQTLKEECWKGQFEEKNIPKPRKKGGKIDSSALTPAVKATTLEQNRDIRGQIPW